MQGDSEATTGAQERSLKVVLDSYKAATRHPVHSFHRYFGKLIPGIPKFAIESFSKPGDLVLDPFCGSGTTLVEAFLAGRRSVGTDINPLATFVSKVKTTPIEASTLESALTEIMWGWRAAACGSLDRDDPYVVNINHWFRPEVKSQLHVLREVIRQIEDNAVREFFLGVFSAFIRGVSNADPQHVFPGYSKRMRALDAAGRVINVEDSFLRASRKRIKAVAALPHDGSAPQIYSGPLEEASIQNESVDLVVTNPPYISSIRYLETMKIEMGWLDLLRSQEEYLKLDRTVTGTERFYKSDLTELPLTGIAVVDEIIRPLYEENPKMAKTVSEYFIRMLRTFETLKKLVRPGGFLVIKIADSKVRSQIVRTPQIFVEMCQELGFDLKENFIDQFGENSRSLLTARNSYSGLMTYDHVLVLQK
jgi:methylase of polypeptide subunit release factors